MKYALTVVVLMVAAQSAFSMTNRELTAKVISDAKFIHSVETDIKNIFRRPDAVKMEFFSIGAQMDRSPYFSARFEYYVKAGSTQMGLCSFIVRGILNSGSVTYDKIVRENCGE